MLIKEADDQTFALAELERLAAGTGPDAKRAAIELRNRKAGIKGESQSAYLIDFDYGRSPNWAVIHDLRLEHGGRTAQIDHLLINRWMEFFVLETKQFHAGVKITDEGEFLRWNHFEKRFEGMPSPLQQNERHIAVLSDAVADIELPSRFGARITPAFNSLVLVAPEARIDRPQHFDTSRVIKADQLKPRVYRDLDLENPVKVLLKGATRMVSGETVRFVAEQLVAQHKPQLRTAVRVGASAREASMGPVTEPFPSRRPAVVDEGPKSGVQTAQRKNNPADVSRDATAPVAATSCKECKSRRGAILYGKFGYYFKCDDCGGNTSVRFTCQQGHQGRVRKEGSKFYRDCAECGTSELFHTN